LVIVENNRQKSSPARAECDNAPQSDGTVGAYFLELLPGKCVGHHVAHISAYQLAGCRRRLGLERLATAFDTNYFKDIH
jgi:hypothetical protein